MKYLTLLFSILILSSSCQRYIIKKVGLEQITEFNQAKVDAFYESFDLTGLSVAKKVIGIEYYELLKQQEQFDTLEKKNLAQPIQFYIMDDQKIIHRMYNCLAPFSFKEGLVWNKEGCYDSFPPNCSIDDYENQFQFLNQQFINKNINREYKIVFLWTNLLTLQSQNALNTLLKGIDASDARANTHISFINTDQIFAEAKFEL